MALLPYVQKGRIEAGCDEAGRGCIAGPVVAAAVILNPEKPINGINDSKQISATLREELFAEIQEKAIATAISFLGPRIIEKINILQASITAMHDAVHQLKVKPEFLLIDGNRFREYPNIPHACFIKGDGRYQSIAAASILAKVARDKYMKELHKDFEAYAWEKNKGYPTKAHRKAVAQFGPTVHHRMSFQLLPKQLKLSLNS
jgi:ribonuclease HII